jgi:hypothetical protein
VPRPLKQNKSAAVYSFFGGVGQEVGREVVRGTEYDFLFAVPVFTPEVVADAIRSLTPTPLQDYLGCQLSDYEFAEIATVLYGLEELCSLATAHNAAESACFHTIPLLIVDVVLEADSNPGFGFMHHLVSMHQPEVLLAVARRFLSEHGEYLAIVRSSKELPRYYLGLLRCGAFLTGAQLVMDFLVEHDATLPESSGKWCRQESKRCVEVRDHADGFTVYSHMLSSKAMSYMPSYFRRNCLRAAVEDKEAGKRLALYNYHSRCEVPTCVFEDVMADIDEQDKAGLVCELEQLERQVELFETQSTGGVSLADGEGC